MALDQKDLELIERVIYKNGDDIAVSIGRLFERLEERMDAMESRLYSRLAPPANEVAAISARAASAYPLRSCAPVADKRWWKLCPY